MANLGCVYDDTSLRRTDELCAADPRMAAVRKLLLKLELEAHRSGWDSPDAMPRIFQVDAHQRIPRMVSTWCDGYTQTLHDLCDRCDGDVGLAMVNMASFMEDFAYHQKTGKVPEVWTGLASLGDPKELRAAYGLPPYVPGTDLFPPMTGESGFAVYGLGMRSEGWIVNGNAPGVEQARRDNALDQHPQRVEVRTVALAGRDGLFWSLTRVRGHLAYVHAGLPDTARGASAGGVANALTRMVLSGVNNPFPIRPLHPADRPAQQ